MVFTWKNLQRLLLWLFAFSVVVVISIAMHPASAEIKASHVAYISHPKEVANLIIEAANSTVK